MLEKTYNPKSFEQSWYQRWCDANAFASDATLGIDSSRDKEPYTIMMPPPNVTGSLHIGHALTFTLQDILIRYHRMQGRDVLWQPGMDHAGIATQMVVERMLGAEGIDRRDLGRDAFIERVWQWKEESGGTISRQLQALGASPDWQRERFTMDEGLSEAVRYVFVKLYEDGLIYRDKRLVNWDPKLQTAISDLEVEQREVKGHYWHLHYPIEGEEGFITVATTRPETMLGDTAVAVHPDDERYQHLIGKHVKLPIVNRLIPIIADTYSDMEKGTGAVKITPAHDFNDFEVGKRHDLPMLNIFDAHACLNDNVPEGWQGLERFEARKKVVETFEELGLLAEVTETKHAVPHGDRSGVPVEPWLMDQWYVDAKVLAEPAIKAVEEGDTKIIPQRWEKTYFEWMRNIQPWCISRQLWWGHRIPVWYAPDGTPFVALDEEAAMKQAEEKFGEPVTLNQDEDVLDTWFSSGLWCFSTLGWKNEDEGIPSDFARYYPGNVLVTGFDIIFFWVARMMMLSIYFMDGKVPFKDVYIHALVRDEKGQKMSKSKGNVMDPLALSDKYGADALRFTLAAQAAQGRDIKLAESRIEGYRNFTTKIWNACRFLQMNGCYRIDTNFDLEMRKEGSRIVLKDRRIIVLKDRSNWWIIQELKKTEQQFQTAIEAYRFNDAADAIYQFMWREYCDCYLESIKLILSDKEHVALNETKTVSAFVMGEALKLLHPIMPFVTEEIWQKVFGQDKMLINTTFHIEERTFKPENHEDATSIIFEFQLISDVRSLKGKLGVPASIKPDLVILENKNGENKEHLVRNDSLVLKQAGLNSITFSEQLPIKRIPGNTFERQFAMILPNNFDVGKIISQLKKDKSENEKEINKLSGKLNNKGFLDKAPPEVVAENQRRLDEERKMLKNINDSLSQLSQYSND